MQKTTVKAPANIAFIKYWGKTDPKTRIPANNSVSMNLSEMYSVTTVEFDAQLQQDLVEFIGEKIVKDKELGRIVKTLDRVRQKAGITTFAKVVTQNNFPKATGIASSASGFASLSMAALKAAGLDLSEQELSTFARMSSGTATRSIPDGFVEWQRGTSSETSYGVSLHDSNHWDICDVVAIVTKQMKKVSSTDGHAIADTSPFYEQRLSGMDAKISALKTALANRNFTDFGSIMEAEALNMHAVCITSDPAVVYWEPPTMAMIRSIMEWRETGELESYFTIDAGPSVHAICQAKDATILQEKLAQIPGVERVVINTPAPGAEYMQEHLF